MKKQILIWCFVLLPMIGWACDACTIFSYNTIKQRSYAASFYNFRSMSGYKDFKTGSFLPQKSAFQKNKNKHTLSNTFMHDKHAYDFEIFQTLDFQINIQLNDDLNLFIQQGYQWMRLNYEQVFFNGSGIPETGVFTTQGNTDFVGGVIKFDQKITDKGNRQIKYGALLNLPTGHNSLKANGYLMHPVNQPAYGALGINLLGAYNYFADNGLTFTSQLNLQYFGKSQFFDDEYNHAARANLDMNLRYIVEAGYWYFVPIAGVNVFGSGKDKMNGEVESETGGFAAMGNFGVEISYKNITLHSRVQLPVYQSLVGNQIYNSGRARIGLIYNFVK